MGALTHTHHEHRPQTRLLFTTFTAALQRALRDMLRLRLPPPRHQQCPVTVRTRLREYVKTALHGWIRSPVPHAALVLGVTLHAADRLGIIWTTWASKAVEQLPGRRARRAFAGPAICRY